MEDGPPIGHAPMPPGSRTAPPLTACRFNQRPSSLPVELVWESEDSHAVQCGDLVIAEGLFTARTTNPLDQGAQLYAHAVEERLKGTGTVRILSSVVGPVGPETARWYRIVVEWSDGRPPRESFFAINRGVGPFVEAHACTALGRSAEYGECVALLNDFHATILD